MDTSAGAQAYFGDSVTESLALDAAGTIHPRGVQVKNFLLTGTAATLTLPTVEQVPNGTRLIVINDPSSLGPLTVDNGALTLTQSFDIPVGELAEIHLLNSEFHQLLTPPVPIFNGAGFPSTQSGPGIWTWDIQTYTAKLALG